MKLLEAGGSRSKEQNIDLGQYLTRTPTGKAQEKQTFCFYLRYNSKLLKITPSLQLSEITSSKTMILAYLINEKKGNKIKILDRGHKGIHQKISEQKQPCKQ